MDNRAISSGEQTSVLDIKYQETGSPKGEFNGDYSKLRFCHTLSVVTIILCSLPAAFMMLMLPLNTLAGAYLAAYVLIGLEFVKYAPFVILITLSAATSLIFYFANSGKTSKLDSAAKDKLNRRSFTNAILLLAPAITYPIAHVIYLFNPPLSNPYYMYLNYCFPAIIIVDLIVFIALGIRKKRKTIIKKEATLRASIIILFIAELILCCVWSFGIIYNKIDTKRTIAAENRQREDTFQSLHNSKIDDGLSDIAATQCKMKPYKTIYSDSKTEGIFACDITDEVLDVFYASYGGKNDSGKIEVSLIELGRIYNNHHIMSTSIIGETKYSYSIIFVDAKNEASANKKVEEYFVRPSRVFAANEREYIFYADGLSAPTTKDYLNVLFASNMYLSSNSMDSCSMMINWSLNEQKYQCVKTNGDLFKRYINDKDNYSSYSIDALFKNRHLYLAPTRESFGSTKITKRLDDFVVFWRNPFIQGKLTFKYLSGSIFDKHDGNLEWENEDTKY